MIRRLNRKQRAGRHLEWKVGAFTVGAMAALAGMYLEMDWLVGVAIVVLLAGMLPRFGGGQVASDDG